MLPSFSLEEQAFVSMAARVRWRARIRKPDSEKAQEAAEQSRAARRRPLLALLVRQLTRVETCHELVKEAKGLGSGRRR